MKMKYEEFVSIMDESFNYKLDFKSWNRDKFLQFCRDFFNGKTEYYMDEYFKKYFAKKCKKALDIGFRAQYNRDIKLRKKGKL